MHPVADATVVWKSTILVNNIHCASCVSHIRELLAPYALQEPQVNVLTGEVQIVHRGDISAKQICAAMDDAFEVYHATMKRDSSEGKDIIYTVNIDELSSLSEHQTWSSSASQSSDKRCLPLNKSKARNHIENCDACKREREQQAEPPSKPSYLRFSKNRNDYDLENAIDEKPSSSKHISEDTAEVWTGPRNQDGHANQRFSTISAVTDQRKAVLSIGGMTCASCTSAVESGVKALDFTDEVDVTLMTNSATVIYRGHENLKQLTETVEDLGYDCEVEKDVTLAQRPESNSPSQRRQAFLKIDGMFCKHCPSHITQSLKSLFGDAVEIEGPPKLSEPVITISYQPRHPDFTIRQIAANIDQLNPAFRASPFQPPSVEERSQKMQRLESQRILLRVLLSFVAAIPTFLIGVVWMTLVPSSNPIRRYFDTPMWAGNVVRREWALFILATPVMFLAADFFHVRAIKEIRSLWKPSSRVTFLKRFYRFGSMNLLVSAGTSVAYFSSVAVLAIDATSKPSEMGHGGNYFDSVVFLTFFILIGRWLEVYSKARTGNAVSLLGGLKPKEAVLIVEQISVPTREHLIDNSGGQTTIDAGFLEMDDVVLVRHGASPPTDGVIVKYGTSFNECSLTGEALPVAKAHGDKVFAGSINVGDATQVKVTEVGGSSMLDQIVSIVREGQTKRAPVERVVDVITAHFVPVITALAILTWLIWLALGTSGAINSKYLASTQGGWAFWSLEFAIAVFVVACPCGIGLAAPTALFVGSGLAAKHGILVRGGGEAFQEASNIDTVVFDKTGTLTEGGNLVVTDHTMLKTGKEAEMAWAIIQRLEESSTHPLARALNEFASSQKAAVDLSDLSTTEVVGRGLTGMCEMDGTRYEAAIGSEEFITSLLKETSLDYYSTASLSKWKTSGKSVAILALRQTTVSPSSDWKIAALFAISDPIRSSTIPTLQALRERNIPAYMLTGDNPTTAVAVASTVGIPADHVFAGMLPIDKADKIKWLQDNLTPHRSPSPFATFLRKLKLRKPSTQEGRKATIAFVGDGTNDAPALTAANVSIALAHPSASDIALTSASFVILSGDNKTRALEKSPSLSTDPSKNSPMHPADPDPMSAQAPGKDHLSSIITLLDLSSRVFKRVKFNFAWACIYNAVLVPIAAGILFRVRDDGWRLGPVWGSAAMAASSVSVVLSSMALRFERWDQLRFWEWGRK